MARTRRDRRGEGRGRGLAAPGASSQHRQGPRHLPRPPPDGTLAEGGGGVTDCLVLWTIKFRKFEEGGEKTSHASSATLARTPAARHIQSSSSSVLAEAWQARRNGGHRGRARGVQVPLRAGGRQLPPKGIRPAPSRPGLAFSRAVPVAQRYALRAAGARSSPHLHSAPLCPLGGPHPRSVSPSNCGFRLWDVLGEGGGGFP